MTVTEDRVVLSINNEFADRCVDIFVRADGSFGHKEFRRDAEDQGVWSLIAYDERSVHASSEDALAAACVSVPWLGKQLHRL